VVVAATGALLAGTVACGGEQGAAESGQSASSGEHSAAVKAAQDEVAKYSAPQPPIEIPELPSKPPSGKTFTMASCILPVCQTQVKAAQEATKLLGWKMTFLQEPYTPEGYKNVYKQIQQSPPDLLATQPILPDSFIKDELAWITEKKIPLVEVAPIDPPKPPVQAVVNGAPVMSQSGRLMGAIVVADAKGPAKSVFLWDPKSISWIPARDQFTKVVEGAGGSVDILKVSKTEIGKAVPNQVVSYLQAHPDVRYVALGLGDLGAGVPQALKAAGLSDKVKVLSRAPTSATLQEIANGEQFATVAEEIGSSGWRLVDQLVRVEMGVPLSGDLANPAGWHQIFTKANITKDTLSTEPAKLTPGVPDAFVKAWHVSG
jgi:ABC-type sugar transport system substrate-binding protein